MRGQQHASHCTTSSPHHVRHCCSLRGGPCCAGPDRSGTPSGDAWQQHVASTASPHRGRCAGCCRLYCCVHAASLVVALQHALELAAIDCHTRGVADGLEAVGGIGVVHGLQVSTCRPTRVSRVRASESLLASSIQVASCGPVEAKIIFQGRQGVALHGVSLAGTGSCRQTAPAAGYWCLRTGWPKDQLTTAL